MHVLYVTDAEVTVALGNWKILFHKSCTKRIRCSLLQTALPCSIYDLKRTGWGFPYSLQCSIHRHSTDCLHEEHYYSSNWQKEFIELVLPAKRPKALRVHKNPVTNLIPNQLNLNPRHISSSCTLLCQWWVTYVPIYRSFFSNLTEFNEKYKLRNMLDLFVTSPLPGSKFSFNYTLLPSLVIVTRTMSLNTFYRVFGSHPRTGDVSYANMKQLPLAYNAYYVNVSLFVSLNSVNTQPKE